MFVATVIISFVLGIVLTLLLQYVILRRWLSFQPQLYPPYKQQYEKFRLPTELWEKWKGQKSKDASAGVKHGLQGKTEDQTLVLNVLLQFLFSELKDTARVRRWTARKLNVEFNDMLSTNLGKFIDQIQVRDFNFGENFPIAKLVELRNFEMKDDVIQTVDVALDLDYEGGFQITLDVDIVFGAWAYLSVTVTKLTGLARLQLTRHPFTHWSFAFYEEPKMEFMVDSRFNGRPIPQISYLIVNQIKRTIRKKHILPSYKMRYKPLFIKPEENYINPDLCFRGNKLGCGQLTVTVLKCTRLQNFSPEGKLYCTLSVELSPDQRRRRALIFCINPFPHDKILDQSKFKEVADDNYKEDMEAVWRQCWTTIDVEIKVLPNTTHLGLTLKDQMSLEKTEKRRVIIDSIVPESLASGVNLMRGDIIETIGSVRVLSTKHANKQIKLSGDCVKLRVKRYQGRFIQEELQYQQQALNIEPEDEDIDIDGKDEGEDFVHISVKDSKYLSDTSDGSRRQTISKCEDKSDKTRSKSLIQTGKRKLSVGKLNYKEITLAQSIMKPPGSEEEIEAQDEVSDVVMRKDQSQSAKSSPQKQFKDVKRQRAHSDTSLNKQVREDDNSSLPGDVGNSGINERKLEQVQTREIPYSQSPEWNEEFEFSCSEEDQYVNVCVWYKIVQNNRSSKQLNNSTQKNDLQNKAIPPTDDLPQYDVTTKIGYVSIPLADIAAGCLLTLQGDTRYTVYLQPPEETITASRSKVPFSGHAGFDRSRCHGDITLSFIHKPELFKLPPDYKPSIDEEQRRKEEKKRVTNDILTKEPLPVRVSVKESVKTEIIEGHHSFLPTQFPSGTYCQFCGKKIWLKGGLRCDICKMVCHKKCVDKCQAQTYCTSEGPKKAGQITEQWTPPQRIQDTDREDVKSTGTSASLFKKFRDRNKENSSLPLNIPQKQPEASPGASPSRSPVRSPSPFGLISDITDGRISVSGMRRTQSNTIVSNLDKDDDSDEETGSRSSRVPGYSLDDTVVLEAKEKGKELFSDLSLPDRKKTLDDMVTKLQDTIDKESEYKAELIRGVMEIQDGDQKRIMSKQIEKCDEKMEALMMMMVHYCAGLQHCLDQEEAHRRLQSMKPVAEPLEDSGIQFIVTDADHQLET